MKQLRLDSKIFQFIKNNSIAALLVGVAILFYACENDIEEIKAFSIDENLPILEVKDFETLRTDSGQIIYTLEAPKFLQFKNEGKEYIEFPEGMELVKFDSKNNIISSLKADYAKQFVKDNKWEAKNNVIATNAQGDTLKTELLIWEEKAEKIYTNEYVQIFRPDEVWTGVGFTSDQNLSNWRINKLKGIFYVDVENNKENSSSSVISDAPIAPEIKQKPLGGQLQFEKQ